MNSLEYTDIPKVFFTPHNVGHCCTNVIRGYCRILPTILLKYLSKYIFPLMFLTKKQTTVSIKHLLKPQNKLNPNDWLSQNR
jgi:hypothetical protein